MTPRDVNARSRVHEYGGGQSVAVDNEGGTITSDFSSNHLKYTETVDAPIVSLTSSSTYRYADMVLDPVRCRLGGDRVVFAVREDHSIDEPSKVVNTIVALSMNDAKSVCFFCIAFFKYHLMMITFKEQPQRRNTCEP